jgi:purine-binding chemotaxis protein CheW
MSDQKKTETNADGVEKTTDYVTLMIAEQLFGIPVLQVQDVLGDTRITRIPLAPPEVAGALNLRGRIVTAIDVRKRLGLPPSERKGHDPQMSAVVEHGHELYSLMLDGVGEVLSLKDSDFEKNPATLDRVWLEISRGIFQLENELMVVIDVPQMLGTVHQETEVA